MRDAGDRGRNCPTDVRQTSFNEAGVRDAGDRSSWALARPASSCFNEAGVRDAGDPHRSPGRRAPLERFNEAGVRDAGDPHGGDWYVEIEAKLQRGRRARRRRSLPAPRAAFSMSRLQRGRRARRRRSARIRFHAHPIVSASTRPACETPEIDSVSRPVSVWMLLQRGRRARRRRSRDERPSSRLAMRLQRGRRARRRRSP